MRNKSAIRKDLTSIRTCGIEIGREGVSIAHQVGLLSTIAYVSHQSMLGAATPTTRCNDPDQFITTLLP